MPEPTTFEREREGERAAAFLANIDRLREAWEALDAYIQRRPVKAAFDDGRRDAH